VKRGEEGKKLPDFLKKYFWDVDFTSLEARKSSKYIIERILEFGDDEAVRWMVKNFSIEAIKDVVCSTRGLSLKSANFWAVVLKIPKEKIKCLNRPYREIRKLFWPY